MTAVESTRPEPASTATASLALRVGGELVGSFLICLGIYLFSTIGLTLYGPYLSFVAIATGLIYGAVTFMLGRVCCCQFNPAVTVAAMLVSKTRLLDGVLAIVAQVLGALAAGALTVKALLPTSDAVTASQWMSYANNGFDNGSFSYGQLNQVGVSFGITAAIVVEVMAGLVIVGTAMRLTDERGQARPGYALGMGVAYGAAAAVAAPVTGAALNPVRATGLAVFSAGEGLTQNPLDQLWVFWICPILAAALVALPMIVAQMMVSARAERAAVVAADDEDDDSLESDLSDVSGDEATGNGDVPESDADTSVDEQADAEVGEQQADAQTDADDGVERD